MDAFLAALAPRRVERSKRSAGLNASQRSKDTWTTNGVDYDIETTTYGNPKGIFYATKKTVKPRDSVFQESSRPFTSGGLMGAAFDILGNMAAAHGEQTSRRDSHARRRSAQVGHEYEDGFSAQSQRHSRAQHRTRSNNRSSVSPTDVFDQEFRRQRTQYDWDTYDQPSQGFANDTQSNRRSKDSSSRTHGAFGADNEGDISDRIDTLKSTVQFEKDAVETCRRRAAQLSSRSKPPRDEDMQKLLDAWRKHETLRDIAIQELRTARETRDRQSGDSRHDKSTRQRDKHSRQSSNRSSKPPQHQSSKDPGHSPFADGDGFHEPFPSFFGHGSGTHGFGDPFFHTPSHPCPHQNPCQGHFSNVHFGNAQFAGFQDEFIDILFGAFPPSGRSGKPKTRTKTSPRADSYEHFPAPQRFSSPIQQPPSTWLRSDEAKSLYKTYAEKWTALAPSDPRVPFPGRDHNARSLAKRDSIYAPKVSAPISTWSEENVMQANVQAFFLGAVGLSPVYSETGPGKLVMSFDKVKASTQQVRDLIDVLKKEKVRWHSDRLGRRNSGSANGPNTTLQQDERARAVFHAVCELMEAAQA
jgi:hypothetical protein